MNIHYVKAIREFDRLFKPVLVVTPKKEVVVIVAKKGGTRLVRRES